MVIAHTKVRNNPVECHVAWPAWIVAHIFRVQK